MVLFFLFSSVRLSAVHNSQHVWLMLDTESQLFLTRGQGCGLDSNDGGSLESGPGSRLGDCGHRQEAWLEQGLRKLFVPSSRETLFPSMVNSFRTEIGEKRFTRLLSSGEDD